jgi:hypothetical protein
MTIRKYVGGAALLTLLLVAGSLAAACDHTGLEGTISPSPVAVSVGDEITLTLEVPAELADIHRETWEVEPESLGTFDCDAAGEGCRQVTFTATSPGTGTISVWGFYQQTNPQFITETDVTVTE